MKRNLNWLDRIMLAVTFAEGDCPEAAREVLAETGAKGACGCGSDEAERATRMHTAQAGANHCH